MLSPTEALILSLLIDKPKGAFGSELIHASGGRLKRGSVYSLLTRMEESGFVSGKQEQPTETYALPRTRYTITGLGMRARNEFGAWTGLFPAGVVAQ